jgi:creatinine deaminase
MESDIGFQVAIEEAKQGAAEGGVPIGACLVDAGGKILGRGHNMRIQKSSAIIHVCNPVLPSTLSLP